MNPDEFDASDTVLVKAEALLQRHRPGLVPDDDLPVLEDALGEDLPVLDEISEAPAPPAPDPLLLAELQQARGQVETLQGRVDKLTKVLAQLSDRHIAAEALGTEAQAQASKAQALVAEAQAKASAALAKAAAEQEAAQRARMSLAEHLISLDAQIAQALEAWLGTELPQLVASELEGMVERLRTQALAHMRATLAPELSNHVSEVLESALQEPPSP